MADLSEMVRKYPKIARVIVAILFFTGIYSLIAAVIILVENKEDFIDAHGEAFEFIKNGKVG